ncbi:hypothetical protein AAOE16_00105 [Ekhidna sp. MALMAid0563]|uniref:hypothetical protein n=1 Tax=Ekhidna sp. MALMAid0563 TaxID=3143937 RepID=UPI0032DEC030
MRFLLGLTLNFLTLGLFAQNELVGTYSYGNGFNFEYLELTEERTVRHGSFSDYLGSNEFKTIGTYELHEDTIVINYRKRRFERNYQRLVGKLLLLRQTDRFIALIPEREIGNWDTYLAEFQAFLSEFEQSTGEELKKIPANTLSQAFEEHGIYVRGM